MGERLNGIQEVRGSIPLASIPGTASGVTCGSPTAARVTSGTIAEPPARLGLVA